MTDEKETNVDEITREQSITAALMELLEIKLNAFMARADLSDSPPEDKVAIRAAFFLGVNAGLSMNTTITEPETESNTEET